MKVAIYFAGFLRDLEITKDYWKKLIDKHSIDVYGSFWETEEDQKRLFAETFSPKDVEYEDQLRFDPFIDMFKKNLKAPYDLTLDLQNYVNNSRILSQFYRVWRGALLTNQKEYDVVIRARTDTVLEENLEINVNEHLNIPAGNVGIWNWKDCWGPLDLFAYGSQKIINYYSTLFLHLNRYLYNGEYLFTTENLSRVHLSQKDLTINYLNTKIWLSRDLERHFTQYVEPPRLGVCHSSEMIAASDKSLTFYAENREI